MGVSEWECQDFMQSRLTESLSLDLERIPLSWDNEVTWVIDMLKSANSLQL